MKEILELILDDLRALKREGLSAISVDDATLANLRDVVELANSRERGNENFAGTDVSHGNGDNPVADSKNYQKVDLNSGDKIVAVPKATIRGNAIPEKTVPAVAKIAVPAFPPLASLDELSRAITNEALYKKHASVGKKWLLGRGNARAEILFVGDMPSADDEACGNVFSDASGTMLNKIIAAMGVNPADCYFTNLFKWRTDSSLFSQRAGLEKTLGDYNSPILRAQIELIKPKIVIALGLVAAHFFSQNYSAKMADLRGNAFEFCGTKVIATYHPNFLVRAGTLQSKRALWEDMLQAMEFLNLPISERQRRYFLK